METQFARSVELCNNLCTAENTPGQPKGGSFRYIIMIHVFRREWKGEQRVLFHVFTNITKGIKRTFNLHTKNYKLYEKSKLVFGLVPYTIPNQIGYCENQNARFFKKTLTLVLQKNITGISFYTLLVLHKTKLVLYLTLWWFLEKKTRFDII